MRKDDIARALDRAVREDRRRRRRETADAVGDALSALVLVMMAAWALLTCSAEGQITRRTSDMEALARLTVHEAGWEDRGDMEAIFAVLQTGAEREGMSWRSFARLYSRRLHAGTVTRRWAGELTENCAEPPSWPRVAVARDGSVTTHAPWSAFRARCVEVMERAREVLSGERSDGCVERPDDWGGRVDRARARRLGLIRVECARGDVETVNDFYRRPR